MKKENIFAIDFARTVSILGVVLIHTTTKVLEITHYDLTNHLFTLFLNQIARFAVPLFFLISGFVLELNHKDGVNILTFYKKRASKIFIPYVFWSLVYYLLIYTNNTDNFLYVLFTGNASYQLYFIPSICIFYLLFPLLHKIYKYLSNPISLIVLAIIQSTLMYWDYFIRQFNFVDPVRISLLAFYIFILGMIGAHIKDRLIKTVNNYKFIFGVGIIFLIFYIFYEGLSRYYQTYNIEAFYSQWRIDILIYTLTLFALLFVILKDAGGKFKDLIVKLSGLSFFVFFVHVIVLENLWKYLGLSLFKVTADNLLLGLTFDLTFFGAVSIFSFLVAILIHKIKYAAKITG